MDVTREQWLPRVVWSATGAAVRRATGNKRLAEELAPLLGRAANDIHCAGCRLDRTNWFARECETYDCCVNQKGVDFCYECPDLPCARLAPSVNSLPLQNIKLCNLVRIQKVGPVAVAKRRVETCSPSLL